MVSQLKSETARTNGAKSHGPTTDEGKEKSSRNAIKHGLTAGNGNILLDCESPDEFDEVQKKLLGIHAPATPAERDIVEEMIAARWRTRRMWTMETNLLNAEILTQASPDLGSAFRKLADDSRSLALASRYEARLQRVYDRAYKTLRELQQTRKSEPPKEHDDIRIRWVSPNRPSASAGECAEPDQPTPGSTAPSVSEEESEEPNPSSERELPNEPTGVTNKEVSTQPPIEPNTPGQDLRSNPDSGPPTQC